MDDTTKKYIYIGVGVVVVAAIGAYAYVRYKKGKQAQVGKKDTFDPNNTHLPDGVKDGKPMPISSEQACKVKGKNRMGAVEAQRKAVVMHVDYVNGNMARYNQYKQELADNCYEQQYVDGQSKAVSLI